MDFKPFKIGKYLLLERIATGGMAEVYRAKASGAGGFEKQLAIKRILPSYSSNEEFRRMFEYEARLSSMLTHANIVQIYDFVKSGDTYLLAMEYVDGKNLRQFVNKAKKSQFQLPIEFGVYVINEVCKGLEYAHKKKDDLTGKPLNIIHRDMSPQNIMLSYDGAVKIVDFGIAKAKDRVDETRSGVIKGKFGYMSPEQANGEPVDHRTDIFSTGIILYELLTGKRLFAADNDMATLKQIQECVIPPPSRSNPKVNAELEKILMKALTKDLSLRYQNAGVFHRNLQEFLSKYFASFTQREVSEILMRIFNDEIAAEKRRFEQIYRQSIPFSQGSQRPAEGEEGGEEGNEEEPADGSITKSEKGDRTAVTYVADEESLKESFSEPEFDPSVSREKTSSGSHREPPLKTKVEPIALDDDDAETGANEPSTSEVTGISGMRDQEEPRRNEDDYPTSERTLVKGKQAGRGGTGPGTAPGKKESGSFKMEDIDRTGSFNTAPTGEKEPTRGRGTGPSGTGKSGTGPSVTGKSGIELTGIEGGSTTNRRRERSYSASHDISGNANEPISLSPVNENAPADPPASRSRRPVEPFRMSDPVEFRKPKSTYFRTLLIIILILGGAALIHQQQNLPKTTPGGRPPAGNPAVPDVPEPVAPPGKAETGTGTVVIDAPAPPPENKSYGDCTIEVNSDPAGARVYMDQVDRGTTSTTVSGVCGSNVNLTLRLEGYEDREENIVFRDKQGKMTRTLKKVPTGRLEVVADRNAKILIEGAVIGEVAPGEKFEKSLRAGRRYKVRFLNEVFKLEAFCDFTIAEDRIEKLSVSLANGTCRKQ